MIDKQTIIIGYFRHGKSKKELSRNLGISPNTVRKYIREHEALMSKIEQGSEPIPIEGIIQSPRYDTTKRVKIRLTEEVCELIDKHLAANKVKRQSGRHKQQMKNVDIHEALLLAGYRISYNTVCRYVRRQRTRSREVYIRQHHEPGQAVEFDWGEVKVLIGGKEKRKMLAVFTSAHSNYRWARLYDRQDMSSFLHAHVKYFAYIGGVFTQTVYDNMRTAVGKFTLQSQENGSKMEKTPTQELLKLSCYYQFDYRFCNARRGNEKGHVEKSVEYVRRKAFAGKDHFESLADANAHLLLTCERLNQKPLSGKTQSIESVFQQERPYLKAVPPAYDTGQLDQLRVDKYSCIKVDTNWYSVPEGHVGEMLQVKVYPDQILVYSPEGPCFATHRRMHTRFEYFLQIDHYLHTLHTKPGALAGSLTLLQAEEELRNLYLNHFKNSPKTFVEMLLFLRTGSYRITEFKKAVDRCLEICPHQELNPDKLKVLLQTKPDEKPSAPPCRGELSENIAQHCTDQLKAIQGLIQ